MATLPEKTEPETTQQQSRPPFLRRVRIRGYKSIGFCDVTLAPLTILVGRNASGKSNFLDALAFLRDVFAEGANAAVESHGGISIFSRVVKDNRLSFEIEAEFPSDRMWCRAVYRIELALSASKELQISREFVQIHDDQQGRRWTAERSGDHIVWWGPETAGGETQQAPSSEPAGNGLRRTYPPFSEPPRTDRPVLAVVNSHPFLDLAGGIRTIGCFSFHPDAIREPQPGVGWPALKRDGRNLARAIEGLREISEEDLDRVQAYLSVIVPEIEGFEVVPAGDRETILFHVRPYPGAELLEFYPSSISDGTLRILASLMAAFQILIPESRSLVAIEEPETSLHPGALRALVDALDEATLRTQILLTTHSAEMLDNPTLRPENLRVVQMQDGQTVIGPVDAASVEIVRQRLDTLGGLERQNQLEPDADDLERQRKLSRNGSPAA